MFERFTNRAQEVIGEAKKAAAQLEQNYIGTEHLLLGLVRVSDSVASKLLQEQGVTEERLEELISSLIRWIFTGSIPRNPKQLLRGKALSFQSGWNRAYFNLNAQKLRLCRNKAFEYNESKYSSALYRACICKGWRCGSGKGRCGITSVYKKCRK